MPELDHKTGLGSETQLLSAAVDSMPCGFSVWSDQFTLVLFNQRYLEIYGLPHDKIVRGMTLSEVNALSLEAGNHPGLDSETFNTRFEKVFLQQGEAAEPTRFDHLLRDRTIRVSIACRPGLGWLVTHEDVSEDADRLKMQKSREQELKLQNMRFEAAVDNMVQGLAMFDGEQNLVICNTQYASLYELPGELTQPGTAFNDIVERRIENGFIQKKGREKHLDRLKSLLEDQSCATLRFEMQNGKHYSIVHRPVGDGGWVSTHEDITENAKRLKALKTREEDLALQNLRFKAAVANLAQGLAMFDADRKLVICNDPYIQLYELTPALSQPGAKFSDIMAHRAKLGMVPEAGGTWLAEQIEFLIENRLSDQNVCEMANGRFVSIVHQSIEDGGWVSTHEDITGERQRLNALKTREAELSLQNNRLDAAVKNMIHGLAMFDADQKLVICNQHYLEIYSLPPEYGMPGTSFDEIMDYRATVGTVPNEKQGKLRKVLKDLVEGIEQAVEPVLKVWEMENGQHVSVSYGPISDGGWVSTHEDVTQRRNEEKQIRHLALHDTLTNLPNRAHFSEEMGRVEGRIARGEHWAILYLDLDRFKEVNDTLGHGVGDEVLKNVSERLRLATRTGEMVARMGGDEFMILVGPMKNPGQAALVAERVLEQLAIPLEVDGHPVNIGASIGIAVGPNDGIDSATLLRNADLALYKAKSVERGSYHFFEPEMDENVQRRRKLEQELRVAIKGDQFTLLYQPMLELESNRVSCCEALLRWNHPQRGFLSPKDFMTAAEETGLIVALGEWALRSACLAAVNWPEHIRVAVNLSSVQFNNNKLVEVVRATLKATGLNPSRLELEITESLFLSNRNNALKSLGELAALGVRISLDDFGTGYSSLNYLRLFPFDKIKIDGSFIAEIEEKKENLEIVRAVIGLAHRLGIVANVEGVETEAQLDIVREQGCHEVQGYLFSVPLPQQSISELLSVTESMAATEAGFTNPADKTN